MGEKFQCGPCSGKVHPALKIPLKSSEMGAWLITQVTYFYNIYKTLININW
jgi:hypothetical protein